MTDQQSLNQLLQWSIEQSDTTRTDPTAAPPSDPAKGLNPTALAELLGAPSDADQMRMSMTAILAPETECSHEDKLIAWDNLEQLIEQIDNANNLHALGMWPPLLAQLEHADPDMRRMAAWCASTAVQNNVKAQETLLSEGGIAALAKVAVGDAVPAVRKKAVAALSSGVRNFQPGLDELGRQLPEEFWPGTVKKDAGEMEQVDEVIGRLREHAAAPAAA